MHKSRVHLDIDPDGIEAGVRQIEGLGVTRVAPVHTWWVMEAPTGQRSCVVRAQSQACAQRANEWNCNVTEIDRGELPWPSIQ